MEKWCEAVARGTSALRNREKKRVKEKEQRKKRIGRREQKRIGRRESSKRVAGGGVEGREGGARYVPWYFFLRHSGQPRPSIWLPPSPAFLPVTILSSPLANPSLPANLPVYLVSQSIQPSQPTLVYKSAGLLSLLQSACQTVSSNYQAALSFFFEASQARQPPSFLATDCCLVGG